MSRSSSPDQSRQPQFPNDRLRVWFLTDGTSPVAIKLAEHLLEYGHSVITVLPACHSADDEERGAQFEALEAQVSSNVGWTKRFKVLRYNVRYGDDKLLLILDVARTPLN